MGIEIVTMGREHIKRIAELESECFSAPWSEKMLEEELYNGAAFFIAAVEGEKICGYAGMYTVLDEGNIMNVAVSPGRRGEGIGKALLGALCSEALRRELDFLTLEVRAGNAAAISMYENAGFTPVGLRKGYYRDPAEDALLMTLFLEEKQN